MIAALFMGVKGMLGSSAALWAIAWLLSKANVLALPVTAVLLCFLAAEVQLSNRRPEIVYDQPRRWAAANGLHYTAN